MILAADAPGDSSCWKCVCGNPVADGGRLHHRPWPRYPVDMGRSLCPVFLFFFHRDVEFNWVEADNLQ